MYLIVVPVLTVALTAAATFLSAQTDVRPDIGSVSFGFPLSWLSISHGFINAPPLWTVDWVGLAGDLVTWLVVSFAAAYAWMRLGSKNRSTRLNPTGVQVTA
jgi:hypothetical protein